MDDTTELTSGRTRRSRRRAVSLVAAALLLLIDPPRAAAQTTFDCVMDPAMVVKVGSEVVGLLDEILVGRGDVVEKGQVIARIASDVEAATVELARVRAASSAEVGAQQSRLDLSRQRLERADILASKNIVAQQKMEELRAEVMVGERELQQAKLRKRLAELELARAEIALDQLTVRSPIDGIVTQRNLSPGEYAYRETHIVTIAQLDPLYVEAFLPVALYGSVHIGTSATVVPGPPIGGEYTAKVTVVDRVFDAASGTFGVRLELPNPNQALPAGQRCRVTFDIDVTN